MRPLAAILLAALLGPAWSAELAYRKEGRGPGVLFIHGFGGNRKVWDEQVARMKKDHTVVTVDLPGHGDSAAPALKEGALDLDGIASELAALARKLKVAPVMVVGHSTGGSFAVRMALADPGAVRGVVLVDAILAPAEAVREEAFMKGLDTDEARTLGDFFGGLASDEAQKARALKDALKVPVPVPVAFFTSSALIPDPAREKEALQRLGMARIPKLTVSYFVNARHWIMWDEPDTFDVLFNDFEAAVATGAAGR